ncbi:hypothetical protein, partial [Hoeflea sp.]|uniref:hypothetical protein n=1 Tax=Hoeflea sp. TaxID=1940281 RepID=UPI0025C6F207
GPGRDEGYMPGGDEIDQCPFCNALWGECMHVKLLLQWETDALVREAREEIGSSAAPDQDPHARTQGPSQEDLPAGSQGGRT